MRLPAALVSCAPAVRRAAERCLRGGGVARDELRRGCRRAAGDRARAGPSSTTSAARGGPQDAIRARIRTPNVFQGRTNALTGSSAPAGGLGDRAAASRADDSPSASAGTSSCGHRAVDRASSVSPSSVWASRDIAWTSSAQSIDEERVAVARERCPAASPAAGRGRTTGRPAPSAAAASASATVRRNGRRTTELDFGRFDGGPLDESQCWT